MPDLVPQTDLSISQSAYDALAALPTDELREMLAHHLKAAGTALSRAAIIAHVLEDRGEDPGLTQSQRIMMAGRMALFAIQEIGEGGAQGHRDTLSHAAELAGVSRRSAARGSRILQHGTPELAEAVEAGELGAREAEDISHLPREQQAEALRRADRETAAWSQAEADSDERERAIRGLARAVRSLAAIVHPSGVDASALRDLRRGLKRLDPEHGALGEVVEGRRGR